MTSVEIIANKVQEILGAQYKIMPYHNFCMDCLKPEKTHMGTQYTADFQAFDENGRCIIATVATTPGTIPVTPRRIDNGDYFIHFWVPLDTEKPDGSNDFNFFGNTDALRQATRNVEISVDNNTKMYLTMGEPRLISQAPERTGSYSRVVFEVTGKYSIMDKRLTTGSDIRISISPNYGWALAWERFFDGMYDLSIVSLADGSDVQKSEKVETESDVGLRSYQINFSIDDYYGSGLPTDPVQDFLRDKVLAHNGKLSTWTQDTAKQKKIFTRVYFKNKLVRAFWGLLSVQLNANGVGSVSRYSVTIVEDGEGEGYNFDGSGSGGGELEV